MAKLIKCESCEFLRVIPGGHVPYGSTTAQFPDDWDCEGDWDTHGKTVKQVNDLILHLFNGKTLECPCFSELPHCGKHPDQYIDKGYGCSSCEEEAMREPFGEEV